MRLVVLLDASGLMELYTGFFVRLPRTRSRSRSGNRKRSCSIRGSPCLRRPTGARSGRARWTVLTLMAQGVGGGTRIGESLTTFNRWHARRVIHSRTCVMILSDGYDTGAPEVLAARCAQAGASAAGASSGSIL